MYCRNGIWEVRMKNKILIMIELDRNVRDQQLRNNRNNLANDNWYRFHPIEQILHRQNSLWWQNKKESMQCKYYKLTDDWLYLNEILFDKQRWWLLHWLTMISMKIPWIKLMEYNNLQRWSSTWNLNSIKTEEYFPQKISESRMSLLLKWRGFEERL